LTLYFIIHILENPTRRHRLSRIATMRHTKTVAMVRTQLSLLIGPSRLGVPLLNVVRPLSTSIPRRDVMEDLDKQLNPREVIEAKRRAFEEKYADKLKRRIER
jgi:hypothetical protein